MTDVTDHNRTPLVLTFHPFNFKVRDVIRKNFHILKNDPETSSIFSNNTPVSFRHSKNIRETLVHSNLPQELPPPCGTFPCGVGQCKTCKFTDSSTTISAPKFVYHIKHHFTCTLPISSTVYHAVDVACFTLEKLEDVWELGVPSTVELSQAAMQTNLLPDTLTMAVIVFQIWKFEPSVPFLVAMIAAKDMKWVSFPNSALLTLLALMNVSVTFNAHLPCLTLSLIDSPSFLFFTPFCSAYLSLCLVLYYVIRFTFLCLHFVLMKSIRLAFILSRDVFVLTRIKTRVIFPDPPLLTPDEGPLLETSILPLLFQVVRKPLPFVWKSYCTI